MKQAKATIKGGRSSATKPGEDRHRCKQQARGLRDRMGAPARTEVPLPGQEIRTVDVVVQVEV